MRTSAVPPGTSVIRSASTRVDRLDRKAPQQRHALPQGGLEGQFAPHGALGDGGDLGPEPGEIRQLVDTFLVDDRGVHVGQQQALAAPGRRLQHGVERRVLEEAASSAARRPARSVGRGRERDVDRLAGVEPRRRAGAGQRGREARNARRPDLGRPFTGQDGRDTRLRGLRHRGERFGMEEDGAILIAGPTASGKSALAMRIAERWGGVVINADSMAVYRDLAVLTGRPGASDLARVPHRLYGHRDAAEAYSVGVWLAEVEAELARARSAGLVPVVVGGTGLFFKALTQGLSDIPPVPEAVRARIRAEAEGVAPEALHARLAALDPLTAARLRPSDPQRDRPRARGLRRHGPAVGRRSRPAARRRCSRSARSRRARADAGPRGAARRHRRAVRRHDGGGRPRRGPASCGDGTSIRRCPALRALGVPPLMDHLAGGLALDRGGDPRSKADTRAYAKRQDTFARHQLGGFASAAPAEADAVLERLWSGRAAGRTEAAPRRDPIGPRPGS